MNKYSLSKKIYPWRNCIAALFTFALVAACVILLLRSRQAMSRKAIFSSEIFKRYNSAYPDQEYVQLAENYDFYKDFNLTYSGLYGESKRFNLNEKISLGDGDIIGLHTGGRSRNPDASGRRKDERRWVDARIMLSEDSRINLYGAGGVGLKTGSEDNTRENSPSAAETLSVGGGFGFSYRLNPQAELLFDYRHSSPLNSDSSYHQSDSAGITLRLTF